MRGFTLRIFRFSGAGCHSHKKESVRGVPCALFSELILKYLFFDVSLRACCSSDPRANSVKHCGKCPVLKCEGLFFFVGINRVPMATFHARTAFH